MSTLRIKETKLASRRASIDNIFALESKIESKIFKKTLFWDYPRILDLTIDLYATNSTYMWFSQLFSFQQVFGYFLSLLQRKTNIIKFYTKFWIKKATFLASRYTSLLLRSKPVQQNWLRFLKNFRKQCVL